MSEKYKLPDVFNEAKLPEITFVPPKEFNQLCASLKSEGKHISLCGPSGCGKTTLAKKALNEANIKESEVHLVNGREYSNINSPIDVFSKIFYCERDWDTIYEWLKSIKILIVDDFHHIHPTVRDYIGRNLKLWHEKGFRFFLIGIAKSTEELIKLDHELSIRNDPFEMKTQDSDFTEELIKQGEEALNFTFCRETRKEIIFGSKGIPSVIHTICRVACIENGIQETVEETIVIKTHLKEIKEHVLKSYDAKYFKRIVGLAKGKQQARSVHNTYFDIIEKIAASEKHEISQEELYQLIVSPILDTKERSKKSTSFYNCMNYLQSVIKQRGLEDAIYYDKTSGTISIEDPSFRFYLSLVDISKVKQQLHIRPSEYPYDVAVSFSGTIRTQVEEFVGFLKENGLDVFYDFDQQHILWGKDLREKLSEVYSNQARYMIIFLTEDYPEQDWPNFEFAIGKEAREKRTEEYLLPVIMDKVKVVGISDTVGYLDGRFQNMESIAECVCKKIAAQ